MRLTMVCAAALVACSGTKSSREPASGEGAIATGPTAPSEPRAEAEMPPAGEDVTDQIRAINSEKYAAPPDTFRKGHVSRKQAPAVKKTKTGFEVQFASHAPVITPAIYQGAVYVSGGFRSKEFHAIQATTGKAMWSIAIDDDGPSSPACAEGTCVFNTESCTIFAVDAKTGEQRWSWWLGDPLTGSPTIADGKVFTSYPAPGVAQGKKGSQSKQRPPGVTHALAAFDLESGELLWQRWLDSGVMSAPVATNGYVYVSTFAGTLIKLEQKTGKIRYAVRARATSAPVVEFASDGLESMYFTRRADGEKAASAPAGASDPAPAAAEEIVRTDHNKPRTRYKTKRKKAKYLDEKVQKETSYAAEGEADDSANGFSGGAPASANSKAAAQNVGRMSVSTMQAFQGSRILRMGALNVNTMGDEIVATDAETGEQRWSRSLSGDVAKVGGQLGTAPLAAGNSVLYATVTGDIVRLDSRSGKLTGRWATKARIRAQPVVAGGWIYVGTEDGRLIAINTKDATIDGWPMWGGDAARTGIKTAKR